MNDSGSINPIDDDAERREFEAFLQGGRKPNDPDWLVRTKGGEYLVPATRSAWAAWQMRGIIAAMAPGDGHALSTNSGETSSLLRAIRADAATGRKLLDTADSLAPSDRDKARKAARQILDNITAAAAHAIGPRLAVDGPTPGDGTSRL